MFDKFIVDIEKNKRAAFEVDDENFVIITKDFEYALRCENSEIAHLTQFELQKKDNKRVHLFKSRISIDINIAGKIIKNLIK